MVRKFLDFASCLEQWQDNDNDGDANDDDNCDDYDDGDDGDDDLPSIAQKNCLHFSICACHPCEGAMLIFSVSKSHGVENQSEPQIHRKSIASKPKRRQKCNKEKN